MDHTPDREEWEVAFVVEAIQHHCDRPMAELFELASDAYETRARLPPEQAARLALPELQQAAPLRQS